MELVLALVGLAVTFYFGLLQRRRGRVRVEALITTKPFNPAQEQDVIYSNSQADKAIELRVHVRSRHKSPVQIESFVVTVPKFIQSTTPAFLVANWPAVDNIPLDQRGSSLPATLPPGEQLPEVFMPGLAIARALEHRGYSGRQVAMLGIFDENRNRYCSKPFELEVESWLNDRGDFLMGFF